MDDIITTDQLMHHRFISARIEEQKKKWSERFEWVPVEQKMINSRLDDIYFECRNNFGDERFQHYARLNRLNKRFTITENDLCLEKQKRAQLPNMEYYKPSVTTNGEYGRIPPSRLYYC